MSLLQLFLLATVAMALVALMRVVRVHLGRRPLPEGMAKMFFLAGFVLVPPIVLGVLTQPEAKLRELPALSWVPLYSVMLGVIAVLMWMAAGLVRRVAHGRSRRILLTALVGSNGRSDEAPIDPPVTPRLAASVALVDRTNAAFPRGSAFPTEIDRPGFRSAWDALDDATQTLEGQIADDEGLGLGVAAKVVAIAEDARSRLDTLRTLTTDSGKVWATG